MSTRATRRDGVTQPRLGPVGWARWAWRQLTSMRTALFLLLLLAIGAVPGSMFPQRSLDPARTTDWIERHPDAGPVLDRLYAFDVYSSPWFSAIYLLLFTSLVGCIVPRTITLARQLRARPPRAPRRLQRLEAHDAFVVADEDLPAVLDDAASTLRRKRFRIARHDETTISAESGYLKEVGNLLFHGSLVTLIVGMAIGHLYGWRADIVVPEGESFVSTVTRYDTWAPGPLVDGEDLTPFALTVEKMTASFEEDQAGQIGMPRAFSAEVRYADRLGGATQPAHVAVNEPLELDDATVFLLGNGYAPVVTVKDRDGQVIYSGATAFLAQDGSYRSTGAIKVGAAQPKQLGLVGLFLPTAVIDDTQGPISVFPDLRNPALAMSVYEGELYPKGSAQSVFSIDTDTMEPVAPDDGSEDIARIWLQPGETKDLPGGRGTVTFDRVDRFAGFAVRDDPGKELVLGSSVVALLGLIASLVIRGRRVFVRVVPAGDGRSVVHLGGMAKGEDDRLSRVVTDLADELSQRSAPAER
ncbi:cytochrome c biogenesis protein ResB [Marihabitans asiaticum]|uniref:Cytochrome c biogenesis protein n=1 Tax=Marihabitans asiaticum TaxID=415218 RepID=A0A560WHX9_9MICO|nr:cytochrome c biogenesis protein ResB [Marihabitans asiaticum]TWD17114.1 cytochrome c biogenesis protein [Marihabitans asiaticum]